jgi:hypothetical protein
LKLKLFGKDTTTVIPLTLLAGGYDIDHGRVTVMVKSDDDRAGTLNLEVSEARKLAEMLLAHTPEVERVEMKGEIS